MAPLTSQHSAPHRRRVHPSPVSRPAHDGGVPLSVGLYTPSADPSGMGQHMLDLAACYVRRGDQVRFLAWPTEAGERLLARAGQVGAVPVRTPHPRDPHFADFITDHLRAHPVDVFHAHVGTGREDFDGVRAARRAGVPVVVQTLHLPWMLSSRAKRTPFFASVGGVDRLITVSQAQRDSYARIGVAREELLMIPNGVAPRAEAWGRATARERLGLSPDQPVVMSVGRLTVMKGHRYLVESLPALLEEFPDLAVVLLGDGHLRLALAERAAALGVSHAVRLPGNRPNARALLDAADVFVLPSLHEGMPLAAMEAMEAGLPVVGTDVTGTSEVVDPGVTGALVPSQDPHALATALAELLRDPALRDRQGAAGRRRYQELFTSARMAAETRDVYVEALAGLTETRILIVTVT